MVPIQTVHNTVKVNKRCWSVKSFLTIMSTYWCVEWKTILYCWMPHFTWNYIFARQKYPCFHFSAIVAFTISYSNKYFTRFLKGWLIFSKEMFSILMLAPISGHQKFCMARPQFGWNWDSHFSWHWYFGLLLAYPYNVLLSKRCIDVMCDMGNKLW